ncbi:hypothetical protein BWQ96_01945 [Gracilariopsis chorda]|uniref:Uncharacterized protein n=1 Tax=Gracilariopsis chorda TaxID=448386 RepID=A0A2V3J1G5_9FLOR|nr:hypothetical protein BWQ96_01945 [Gracilariopsis chorda]|eukprot:PXF48256.1 hypothetical protein BWQ96_01945 [Gracilariopsis chorda]
MFGFCACGKEKRATGVCTVATRGKLDLFGLKRGEVGVETVLEVVAVAEDKLLFLEKSDESGVELVVRVTEEADLAA